MDITVKISDLLWKVRELNRDEMDYVTLSVIEAEDDMPACLTFYAFTEKDPNQIIDYESIDESEFERDEGPVIVTNIKD